jgi:iron complex transport system ATP-binding protein
VTEVELLIEGLYAGYPGRTAVDGLDLAVRPGELTAVVGPNGCGKSTLLRAVARLHRPAAGRVLAGGADLWSLRPRQAARRVALLPQSPRAPEAITVRDLVRYGRHPHQGLFRQWSRGDEEAVAEALSATATAELADRRLDELSGGQRQRCWLAMVLAQQTPVVLLDEPTSALDLGHAVEVLDLARAVARSGRTVVAVLHDLSGAARYADTLVALRAGRLLASGPPREVVSPSLVRELYGVRADVLAAPGDGAPVVVPAAGPSAAGPDQLSPQSFAKPSR